MDTAMWLHGQVTGDPVGPSHCDTIMDIGPYDRRTGTHRCTCFEPFILDDQASDDHADQYRENRCTYEFQSVDCTDQYP